LEPLLNSTTPQTYSEQFVARGDELARLTQLLETALGGELSVLHRRLGNSEEAADFTEQAMEEAQPAKLSNYIGVVWGNRAWPLTAAALKTGDLSEALEHARALIHPAQMKLPDELAKGLAAAVRA
jgi:hypothetical protein